MNPSSTLGHVRRGHIHRGFTLIELLVVIAIIGILSSVVLASLNTARQKATDAKIASEIRSVAANSNLYYDQNAQSYGPDAIDCVTGMFAASSPDTAMVIADLQTLSPTADASCQASATAWAISHPLTATVGQHFCADNTGKIGTTSAAVTTTACP